MRKTWKKFAALTTAAVLAAGSLAGCSSKPADTKVPDTTAQTTAAPGETKAATEAASAEASKDPVTVTMVAKDMSADDPVTVKLLETVAAGVSKTLGREVTIELAPISEGTYSESMSLLLQSGDIPDLMPGQRLPVCHHTGNSGGFEAICGEIHLCKGYDAAI